MAPATALRQAQIGIAVASATDVAKAAAGMALTEPGLSGIVFAVRERIAFRATADVHAEHAGQEDRHVLGIGVGLTGHPVMTPVLMVLTPLTNDFLLTTDRASLALRPSVWRMQRITAVAVLLGEVGDGRRGGGGRLTEELQTSSP